MALNWLWSEKCGEATFRYTYNGDNREYISSLYVGNAYLIFINEYTEDGVDKYSLSYFWLDKAHMKNCLGLNKKEGYVENILNKGYRKLVKIRLNKKKCKHFKDIITALAQAFDDITIEIYSE